MPADGIDKLVDARATREGGVQSSIHNPANAMIDDPPAPPITASAVPVPDSSVELTAQQAMMHMIMTGIGKINERMTLFEDRLQAAETNKRAPAPMPAAPASNTAPKDPRPPLVLCWLWPESQSQAKPSQK